MAYNKELAETYDSKRFISLSGKRIHDIEVGILIDALSYVPTEAKILEVGCGTGRLLEEACQDGYSPKGLDASPYMLKISSEKFQDDYPETSFVLGEAARLPFTENSHDLLYSIRVLNQTVTHDYALNVVGEMIRVAKPASYVLVEFMNYYRLEPFSKRGYLGSGSGYDISCVDSNVRIRPKEVLDKARECGATLIWFRGGFFLGMTTLRLLPEFMIGLVSKLDQFLSKQFPRLCSRCYVLLQKGG